jgi:CRISPR-associated protein Csd1
MILSRLKEYADTRMSKDLTPEMYTKTPVRWILVLDAHGKPVGSISQGGDSKANARGESRDVPHIVRSSGIQPKLLVDNGEYVLGIGRPSSKPSRVAESHRQFVELVNRCAEETGEESVRAVARFLASWDPDTGRERLREDFRLRGDFDPGDTLAFEVAGVYPVDLESVQTFWATYTAGEESVTGTCLVTGLEGPVVDRLPVKIKGVPGGQTSGTSLVSANAEAFTSYGLKNSLTSPISRLAGERFGKALNHLISERDSRAYVGPMVYVFWTREETPYDWTGFVEQPKPEAVRLLFESVKSGKRPPQIDPNQFYALALSASGGRAVVRDWMERPEWEVRRNLVRWLEAQELTNPFGDDYFLGTKALARATEQREGESPRKADERVQSTVVSSLTQVAFNGGRLPDDLLARVVRRNRAEGGVTRPRAALIKLLFTTQGVPMIDMKALNASPDFEGEELWAYNCGRLLAEIEAVQRAALGQVNATVTDRYFGAASSTPGTVFPALVRNAQNHLGKLRRTNRGKHAALEAKILEIKAGIGDFPKTLTMRSQGLFALGYWHQRARDLAEAKAAREAQSNREES